MRRSVVAVILGLLLACSLAAFLALLLRVPLAEWRITESPLLFIARAILPIAAFSMPFALAAIALSEARRVRGLPYWMFVGALTGILGFVAASGGPPDTRPAYQNMHTLFALAAMGFAGGFVYWWAAGRHAGRIAADLARSSSGHMSEEHANRRCWGCVLTGIALSLVPLALLGWYSIYRPAPILPDRLISRAERDASALLAKAGVPALSLKVTDYVGHLIGQSASSDQRGKDFQIAKTALAPMVGLPGIVAYVENDIAVAEATRADAGAATVASAEDAAKRRAEAEAAAKAAAQRVAEAAAATKAAEDAGMAAADAAKRKSEGIVRAAEAAAKENAGKYQTASEPLSESQTQSETQAEAKREAEAQAREAADAARIKAEADRIAAEAAAKAKAEEQAKAEMAAEANRKADGEARAAAEAAVKAEAERVARAKAEAERLAAELEAKRKAAAELEAREAAAREEARRVAEAEAERKAVDAAHAEQAAAAAKDAEAKAAAAKVAEANAGSEAPCAGIFSDLFRANTIRFRALSAAVDPDAKSHLDAIADAAKKCPGYALAIGGHTDRIGSAAGNMALSLARADAVREALIARGIEATRLSAAGYGGDRPFDPANTPAAYALNRRVDFGAAPAVIRPAAKAETVAAKAEPPSELQAPPQSDGIVTPPAANKIEIAPADCAGEFSRLFLADVIRFRGASSRVAPEYVAYLDRLASLLGACASYRLAIGGHTDRRGSEAANQRLSEARALRVKQALIARGVAASRLSAQGYAGQRPFDPGSSREAFALNRRVDFGISELPK